MVVPVSLFFMTAPAHLGYHGSKVRKTVVVAVYAKNIKGIVKQKVTE